jgi:hypothetical protein
MSEHKEPISLIEVRKAANGFVVSAFAERPYNDLHGPRGYNVYVCESDDPKDVGQTVAKAIKEFGVTENVLIPPARRVP